MRARVCVLVCVRFLAFALPYSDLDLVTSIALHIIVCVGFLALDFGIPAVYYTFVF